MSEERPSARFRIEEASERWIRAERAIQRIVWAGLLAVPVVAATGLLGGDGPLTERIAVVEGSSVMHPRVARAHAATRLRAHAEAAPSLAVSSSYLSLFQIERMTPAAARESIADGWHVFTFAEPATGEIVLDVRARESGHARGHARVGGGGEAPISTLVLP